MGRCQILRGLTAAASILGAAGLSASASAQCGSANYVITQSTGDIVPGTTDSGNHYDDAPLTVISLPFTWSFYSTAYTQAQIGSNGVVTLGSTGGSTAFGNGALPSATFTGATMFPYWDDLDTRGAAPTYGVYTGVSGSAPNRIFNIEFRDQFYPQTGSANFEVRLYEGQSRFDFVYGTNSGGGSGGTIGCQQGGASGLSTQFAYSTANNFPAAGTVLTFGCPVTYPASCSLALTPATGATLDSFVATATVTPGSPASPPYSVSLDASAINAGTVTLYDDGPGGGHGDAVAGDNIFTNNVTVGAGTPNGAATLTSTVTQQDGQTSTCTATYTVATVALAGTGAANPVSLFPGFSTLLTVNVTPATGPASTNLLVTGDLSSIGGSSTQQFYDDGTHGDVTAGDHIYSYNYLVPGATALSNYTLPFTVSDAQARSVSGTIPLTVGYCTATSGFVACSTVYEYISNVTVGTINNSSTCSGTAYEDYTSTSTGLAPGQSAPISVTIGNPFTLDECTVWVDWDGNGSFDDSEAVPLTFNPYPTFTGTITPPASATVGPKRMRVRLTYNTVPAACGDSGAYGNIEDYTINVLNPSNPIITGNPASGTVGSPILLTANVTPGQNPPSTSLTVTGDLSSIGGPASQLFYDNGTHGDATAGDGVYSVLYAVPHDPTQSAGNFTVPVSVVDNLNRSTTSVIGVTLASEPLGGCCTGGTCSVATSFNCSAGGGTWLGAGSNCTGGPNHNYVSDPNLGIPDAGAPVSDTINVSDNFTLAQVTVRVAIPDHTFIGDLTVDISNGASTVRVWNRQCGGDNGMDVTFDDTGALVVCAEPTTGTYAPSSPLNVFNGGSSGGAWTITVQDWAAADVGTLTHWELNLHEPVSCGPLCGTADFNCDGDVGTDSDIEAFFACLAGNCPAPPCMSTADFNGDGDVGTDSDIEAFFRVLAGGNC